MITYINKENAQAYSQLFNKAEKVLKAAAPDSLGIRDWDNFTIGSLNEYFAYLETLMQLNTINEEQKKLFVRLPLDEDVFEINADSRSISIPSTFSRYGVGVQGDEMAEVVYFTIDRFFDSTDLAGENIKIAIQWETKGAAGFSKNFGKEIINVKDKSGNVKSKIIFGWPISSEMTKSSGTIKFAVRFYSIETIDGQNQFTYSFTTLPAEISVNATLLNDDVKDANKEIDHGKAILGRIRSSGIYDPDASEIPEEPTITTDLHALGSSDRIVDLPGDNSGIELAVAAQPTTSGTVSYRWNKYDYIKSTGDYSNVMSYLPAEDSVTKQYIEVTSNIPVDDISYFYNEDEELIALDGILEEVNGYYVYAEDRGFKKANVDAYIKVYKQFSVATVHATGKYIVTVVTRSGANTAEKESATITIPGPLKPVVSFPEGENISNDTDHIIVDNGESATLSVAAVTGEAGKDASIVGANPSVALAYSWKKRVGENAVSVDGETAVPGDITVSVIPASSINWEGEYGEENNEKARGNQSKVSISQNGDDVTVYVNGELEEYASSNPNQTPGPWVALDIDTHSASIIGLTWNGAELGQEDVDEAASIGLGAGHIVYWAKADKTIAIGDGAKTTTLDIVFEEASSVRYEFNADKSEMIISNLPASGLDDIYFAEVTATRNGISTTSASGDYRITNTPEKPVIKFREYDRELSQFKLVVRDYKSENNTQRVTRRPGQVSVLSFSVEPPAQSDALSYVWMRINADNEIASDWENGAEKLQADLDDAIEGLAAIIGNPEGSADFPVEASTVEAARKYFSKSAIGDIASEDFEDNGPKYELSETDAAGYYYCVVINELNGHINANVSPFFQVS